MAEPRCCSTPMVHNSFTGQYECADAYFLLHDDGVDPYLVDADDLDAGHRVALEHWKASRIDDEAVA